MAAGWESGQLWARRRSHGCNPFTTSRHSTSSSALPNRKPSLFQATLCPSQQQTAHRRRPSLRHSPPGVTKRAPSHVSTSWARLVRNENLTSRQALGHDNGGSVIKAVHVPSAIMTKRSVFALGDAQLNRPDRPYRRRASRPEADPQRAADQNATRPTLPRLTVPFWQNTTAAYAWSLQDGASSWPRRPYPCWKV